MRFLNWLVASLLIALLTACGGGGGSAGTTPGTNPGTIPPSVSPTVQVGAIELLLGASSLPSTSSSIAVTAVVKNANNVGMPNQAITFSADSGNLTVAAAATDANGVVNASISSGSNKVNRDIRITVSSGGVSSSVIVPVVGSRVQVTGPGSVQAGAAPTVSVKLVDSGGLPVIRQAVTLRSQLGNSISDLGAGTTDGNGVFSFIYTANIAGSDTLTATGLGSQETFAIFVSNTDFSAVTPSANASIPVNSSQAITVRYKVAGVGVAGQAVNFTSSRGVFSANSAVTNGNGDATVNISSSSAGLSNVVAQIASVGQVVVPLQFVATTPSQIALQANPGAVTPNASGSVNQASLEAIVRDVSGNAVANRQVNFSLLQDASNGSLSQNSALTDINGKATVQFIPGANSTASNGVIVRAQVALTAIATTTAMTVSGQSLFVSIGFGNDILNRNPQTYERLFTVYVTDANGAAVGNKQVTLRAIPTTYFKGSLVFNTVSKQWVYNGIPTECANEDVNLNGTLDGVVEDINGNGSLDPGNVAVADPRSVVTDAKGFATFSLVYGEQFAPWVLLRLEARTTVSGTESVRSINYFLNGLASDFTDENVPPAGSVSPFGVATSCTNPN